MILDRADSLLLSLDSHTTGILEGIRGLLGFLRLCFSVLGLTSSSSRAVASHSNYSWW